MSIFKRLAAQTGFSRFLDFVSPTLFDVMPFGAMARAAMSLVGDYRDETSFHRLAKKEAARLERLDLGVVLSLDSADRGPLDGLPLEQRVGAGESVLALYFQQLLDPGATLLDLSRQRFTFDGSHVVWRPGRGHVHWDEDFRDAMANVYISYYEDGGDTLAEALAPLGLGSAASLFLKHFGTGEQHAVVFTVDHFVDSFHQVFLHCKANGIRLHRNFLPLGIYLATMYETLEAIGEPLDVRAAFLLVRARLLASRD